MPPCSIPPSSSPPRTIAIKSAARNNDACPSGSATEAYQYSTANGQQMLECDDFTISSTHSTKSKPLMRRSSSLSLSLSSHEGRRQRRPSLLSNQSFHNSSNQSLSSTGSRRSVSFSPSVKVRKSLLLSDYTPKERQQSWYGANELEVIKTENKAIVGEMQSGGAAAIAQKEDLCTRGLECRLPRVVKQRYQRRKMARQVVLQEQQHGDHQQPLSVPAQPSAKPVGRRQSDDGDAKDTSLDRMERLAMKYKHITRESQMAAFRMGRMDQRDAAKR